MKIQYSWFLMPLLFILYFYIPQYVIPLMLCVALIGCIEILFYDKTIPLGLTILQILLHLLLLICLFKFNNVKINNFINYLILLISIFFILFFPYYPYYMSRNILLFYFITIYLLSLLTNYLIL